MIKIVKQFSTFLVSKFSSFMVNHFNLRFTLIYTLLLVPFLLMLYNIIDIIQYYTILSDIKVSLLPFIFSWWSDFKYGFSATFKPGVGTIDTKLNNEPCITHKHIDETCIFKPDTKVEEWRQEVYNSMNTSGIVDKEYYISSIIERDFYICSPFEESLNFISLITLYINWSTIVNSLISITLLNIILRIVYLILTRFKIRISMLKIFTILLITLIILSNLLLIKCVLIMILFSLLHLLFVYISRLNSYNKTLFLLPGFTTAASTIESDSDSSTDSDDYLWINSQHGDTDSDVTSINTIDLDENYSDDDNAPVIPTHEDITIENISSDPEDLDIVNFSDSDTDNTQDSVEYDYEIHTNTVNLELIITIFITSIIIHITKFIYNKSCKSAIFSLSLFSLKPKERVFQDNTDFIITHQDNPKLFPLPEVEDWINIDNKLLCQYLIDDILNSNDPQEKVEKTLILREVIKEVKESKESNLLENFDKDVIEFIRKTLNTNNVINESTSDNQVRCYAELMWDINLDAKLLTFKGTHMSFTQDAKEVDNRILLHQDKDTLGENDIDMDTDSIMTDYGSIISQGLMFNFNKNKPIDYNKPLPPLPDEIVINPNLFQTNLSPIGDLPVTAKSDHFPNTIPEDIQELINDINNNWPSMTRTKLLLENIHNDTDSESLNDFFNNPTNLRDSQVNKLIDSLKDITMLSVFIFPFYILDIYIIDMNLEQYDDYCEYLDSINKPLPPLPDVNIKIKHTSLCIIQ